MAMLLRRCWRSLRLDSGGLDSPRDQPFDTPPPSAPLSTPLFSQEEPKAPPTHEFKLNVNFRFPARFSPPPPPPRNPAGFVSTATDEDGFRFELCVWPPIGGHLKIDMLKRTAINALNEYLSKEWSLCRTEAGHCHIVAETEEGSRRLKFDDYILDHFHASTNVTLVITEYTFPKCLIEFPKTQTNKMRQPKLIKFHSDGMIELEGIQGKFGEWNGDGSGGVWAKWHYNDPHNRRCKWSHFVAENPGVFADAIATEEYQTTLKTYWPDD